MRPRFTTLVLYSFYICMIFLIVYLFYFDKIEHALSAGSITLGTLYWIQNRKDEIKSMQRNKRLEFLEDSYKKIAMGVMRDPDPKNESNKKFQEGLEEAVAVIQLYGEKELIQTLINKIPEFDDVLKELRDSLRKEFGLKAIENDVRPMRMNVEYEGIKKWQSETK